MKYCSQVIKLGKKLCGIFIQPSPVAPRLIFSLFARQIMNNYGEHDRIGKQQLTVSMP